MHYKSSKITGYTLLEILVYSSLIFLIIDISVQAAYFGGVANQKTEKYIKLLHTSQYLYWLFYNQISENIGLNLESYIASNYNNYKSNIKKSDLRKTFDYIVRNNINYLKNFQSKKAEILPNKDANSLINSKHNNLKNLVIDSDLIVINTISFNPLIIDKTINSHGSYTETKEKSFIKNSTSFYFVAHNISNNKYSLYKYTNNRYEELIENINSMIIKKTTKNNSNYYLFDFIYEAEDNKPEKIFFIIKESLINFGLSKYVYSSGC